MCHSKQDLSSRYPPKLKADTISLIDAPAVTPNPQYPAANSPLFRGQSSLLDSFRVLGYFGGGKTLKPRKPYVSLCIRL